MTVKRIICLMCIFLLLFVTAADASGLFPKTDELFGTAMPSISFAIYREADEKTKAAEGGEQEIYHNFFYDDYLAFGRYLGKCGAEMLEYSADKSSFTAVISANNSTMRFSYSWGENIGVAIYSSETRAEKEAKALPDGECIFPPVGGIMPSAQFAIKMEPSAEETTDEGTLQHYYSFDDNCYKSFSAYLGKTGASLSNYQIENGVISATIALNGYSILIKYDWKAKEASVFYPKGTTPEEKDWNVLNDALPILPDPNMIGNELPRISQAIQRVPNSTAKLTDGGIEEVYSDFSEGDYNTFSQYLSNTDCKVNDYHAENGIIIIQMGNATGQFTFSYDALRHEAKISYPRNTRVERAWAPTPTPAPTATPVPTAVVAYYSENQCWNIAETYFTNMSWKNPESLKVHGHTSSFNEDEAKYTFTIDYSAMNGFGGYNRSYYWIVVSANTGRVLSAIGGN